LGSVSGRGEGEKNEVAELPIGAVIDQQSEGSLRARCSPRVVERKNNCTFELLGLQYSKSKTYLCVSYSDGK
jgi:hypothetical protein